MNLADERREQSVTQIVRQQVNQISQLATALPCIAARRVRTLAKILIINTL